MSNYTRQAKRKNLENKAPRCCGRHMVKTQHGNWVCRRCGRQILNVTFKPTDEVVQNGQAQILDPSVVNEQLNENTSNEIIDVEAEVVEEDMDA